MRARWLLAMLFGAVALGYVLTACDSDSGQDSPATVAATPEVTPASPASDAPPSTTASAGGRTVEMGIGTYCWTRICVDALGPITKGRLDVSRRDRVIVAVPAGTPPLREVNVTAFPAGASQDFGKGETAWQPDYDRSTDLISTRTGQTIEFTADLPPGSYVVSVGMFFEPGDVQYGVVLEVK